MKGIAAKVHLMRGGEDYATPALDITRYTIYNYMKDCGFEIGFSKIINIGGKYEYYSRSDYPRGREN